jgi:transcriptional regulator with XRE-family HTH domain
MAWPVNDWIRERLRRIRNEKGFKAKEVALRAGLPSSSYSCLESGFYRITVENLFKVVAALEISILDVWPCETYCSQVQEENAGLRRVQAFRLGEVIRLSEAEGGALFRIHEDSVELVLHHTLSDFLLDRLVLYLENGIDYNNGCWFRIAGNGCELSLFLKANRCPPHVKRLIKDYLALWLEIPW